MRGNRAGVIQRHPVADVWPARSSFDLPRSARHLGLLDRLRRTHRLNHSNVTHQQYLERNRYGYCPDNGTGVSCPVGLFTKSESPGD